MAKRADKKSNTTIIKREEVIAGGHHGGAWKVAYADFVTAMMAFFLLMWLLNATTDEQRRGLADYFSPTTTLAHGASGSGDPFGGHTPYDDGPAVSDRGAIAVMNANAPPVDVDDDGSDTQVYKVVHNTASHPAATDGAAPGAKSGTQGGREAGAAGAARAAAKAEQGRFDAAAAALQKAVAADPQLVPLARQLSVDMTPEGLRIQIRDTDGQPMFATGSAEPNDRARALLRQVAPVLMKLSEPVSVAGYTDAAPYAGAGRSNWDLSADRANATRRLLLEAGLPEPRLTSVTGHADRDLLLPAEPLAAANRRIAILVLRSVPPAASPAP